jgi:hypothetical protein
MVDGVNKNASSETSNSAFDELPDQQEALGQIDHLYHQACHCVCTEKQLTLGAFQAIAHCRSLLNVQVTAVIDDPQTFATAREALERAVTVALGWTLAHQNETRVVRPQA